VEDVKERRQGLISSLEERLADLNSQVTDLQTLLANNKMLHTSREIDDSAYQIASVAIRSGLERTLTEKKDIEEVVDHLSKLETMTEVSYQPPVAPPTPTPEKPKESRDIIVVHVKEKT
jgi:t-SNARE complex subunit (syntaxin)